MSNNSVIPVNPTSPDPRAIRAAAQAIREGRLVAFPTETVYGLGANALDPHAVIRIFVAKGRPPTNPLIVHVSDIAAARELASNWPAIADRLATAFWPGPLTLVLDRKACVPTEVTGGGATVAIRVSAHPIAQALIAAAGVPIAAPSANRSTHISPTRAEHVLRSLGSGAAMILDGGPTPGGIESTVLDVTTSPPRLLRHGPVTASQLAAAGGKPILAGAPIPSVENNAMPARSPGLQQLHYAPAAPLCLMSALDAPSAVGVLRGEGKRVGWLSLTDDALTHDSEIIRIVMPVDSAAYAARLYDAMHILEGACVEQIVVDLPPFEERWLAVLDRLRRATHSEDARNAPEA